MQEEPLGFLDKDAQALPESPRNMWCTGPFLHAAGREIYRDKEGRWFSCTPEKAKELGVESQPVEVYRFEPVSFRSVTITQDGKLIPEFHDAADDAKPVTVQVFRYTHPDYNSIMPSVLASLLETL